METELLTMNINSTRISSEILFLSYVSDNDCIIYRVISIIFISILFISCALNIRFIIIDRHRFNSLTLSLVVSSIVQIICSFPYVLFQSIKCSPVHSDFICWFEGFTCFTCGICVMYIMCLISFVQYIRLFYNTTMIHRIIQHRYNYFMPCLCWFISFLWSVPPMMNIKPGFKREGQGFDCGLNWIQTDIYSHLYIFLAFICIYFLPLICLLYTHIRILVTIRTLIYRRYPFISKNAEKMSNDKRRRLIHMLTITESNRLKRLRIDRKFAKATMITVLYYFLAWTPYAACGMLQTIVAMKQTHYQLPSMLITASALTAKTAVIGQFCVYFYTISPSNR